MQIKKRFLLVLLFFHFSQLFCQEKTFTKSSLRYSVGAGIAQGYSVSSFGEFVTLGYGYLLNNNLRINPSMTLGYLDNSRTTDLPDENFVTIDFETLVSYDLIRYKGFSLMVGVGGFLNNTRGLIGTGGFEYPRPYSEFYSNWHGGGLFTGGLRINPPKSRIAIEIVPFNLYAGFDKYFKLYAKVGMEVKL